MSMCKRLILVSRRRKCQRMAHACIKYNLIVERRQTKAQDVVQVTIPSSDFSEGNKGIKQNRTYKTVSHKHSINFLSVS